MFLKAGTAAAKAGGTRYILTTTRFQRIRPDLGQKTDHQPSRVPPTNR
jgi:hypothetical protein